MPVWEAWAQVPGYAASLLSSDSIQARISSSDSLVKVLGSPKRTDTPPKAGLGISFENGRILVVPLIPAQMTGAPALRMIMAAPGRIGSGFPSSLTSPSGNIATHAPDLRYSMAVRIAVRSAVPRRTGNALNALISGPMTFISKSSDLAMK